MGDTLVGPAGIEQSRRLSDLDHVATIRAEMDQTLADHRAELARLRAQVEQLSIMFGVATNTDTQYRVRKTDGGMRTISPREAVDYIRQGYRVEYCSASAWLPYAFPLEVPA